MLLGWAETLGKPYFVWTSNIDGMFVKAGFPPDAVIACHGDLHHLQCRERTCPGSFEEGNCLELMSVRCKGDVWSAELIPNDLDSEIDPKAWPSKNPFRKTHMENMNAYDVSQVYEVT